MLRFCAAPLEPHFFDPYFLCVCEMIDPNSPVFCKIQPKEGCTNKTFFEVGKLYEMNSKPKNCKNGFHCCLNFLECFGCLGNNKGCRYFRVQLGTNVDRENEVFCSNEMRVIGWWFFCFLLYSNIFLSHPKLMCDFALF